MPLNRLYFDQPEFKLREGPLILDINKFILFVKCNVVYRVHSIF